MHAVVRHGATIALLLATSHSPARADMTVYYHAGSWDAFSGPGEGGAAVCGVGITNPTDGRSFSLRMQMGADAVTFQAKKPSWDIPNGTALPVVMQIGLDPPWNMQGSGSGQIVTWMVDRNAMQSFDAQFRRASSMTLTFPSGNEVPWTVSLSGSTAISNAFGRCVNDMMQRGQAPGAPPPQPAGPTQPFGGTPAAPPTNTPPPQPGGPPPTQQ